MIGEIPTPECLLKEFNGRISANLPINESVDLLFRAIQRWSRLANQSIIPYCFDLKLEPIEECGVIQFNRSALWIIINGNDGLRYDITVLTLYIEGRSQFDNDRSIGRYEFKEGISSNGIIYESNCQTQGRALQLFLDELELYDFPDFSNLNSVRLFSLFNCRFQYVCMVL